MKEFRSYFNSVVSQITIFHNEIINMGWYFYCDMPSLWGISYLYPVFSLKTCSRQRKNQPRSCWRASFQGLTFFLAKKSIQNAPTWNYLKPLETRHITDFLLKKGYSLTASVLMCVPSCKLFFNLVQNC